MNKTIKLSLFTIALLAGVVLLYNSLRSETSVHQTFPPMEEQVIEEPVLADKESVRPGDNRRQYKAETQEGYIGWFESKPIDNPLDNIFHVTIEDSLTGNETIWLDYELHGVEDYTGVAHSINDQLSVGGYLIKKNNAWSQQREQLHPSVLKQGDNVVRFTIPEDADYGYRVRNLSIIIEAFNEVTSQSHPIRRLVVNQPTSEFYYGELGYLQGYVLGDAAGNAQVLVEDEPVRYNKGSFESLVKKKGQAEKWTVTVKAVFADGQVLSAEVNFNKPAEWDVQSGFDKSIHYTDRMVGTTEGFDIRLPELRLHAEPGVVDAETHVSVTALRARDIAALDAGMVNVTANQAGYRFLPHGTQFKKDVMVEMAYDTTKIPNGYGVNDIRTYFFSEATHHWVAIPRDTVLLASNTTVSRTNHFSDYINAIIKVPESPETQGYTPTSMKDVKAANPATGINLIQPPSANSMGNANLSYPINIPAGRQGMQPQLGISYNSGGGNGWLGLGWDLSVPAITVDTRWGVPRYHKTLESETYVMGGEQLSPVAHRTKWTDRETDKQFYPRIEGSFSKIIRHGTNPADYWWEVTDKSGVKYYYGGVRSIDNTAVLKDYEGNIAHWALTRIEDMNGNFIKYTYEIDKIENGDRFPSQQIYLSQITYTGFDNQEGLYSIEFSRNSLVDGAERKDVSFDARYAFKRHEKDLLKRIDVKFNKEIVRSYKLEYSTGAFYKTLLKTIVNLDGSGNEFYSHSFDYYNDVNMVQKSIAPFENGGSSSSLTTYDDNNGKVFVTNIDNPTALSGNRSTTTGGGGGVYVGLGGNVASLLNTVGGSYSRTMSEGSGVIRLIDINGDGRPDKLMKRDGDSKTYYRPQLVDKRGELYYGAPIEIIGLNDFHLEESITNSYGISAILGASKLSGKVGYNRSSTKTKTKVYFADVNGDGLIDIVENGSVKFNRINKEGHPEFYTGSHDTPNPIEVGNGVSSDLMQMTPDEIEEIIAANPLHDVVRVWEAPYTGVIDIDAPIKLLSDDSAERQNYAPDGVTASVQVKEDVKWEIRIAGNDTDLHQPTNLSNLSITKGEKVYFRLHSVKDGAYDQVEWNPEIRYTNFDCAEKDANGLPFYVFNAANDFLLTGDQEVTAPIDGSLVCKGYFEKAITTDTLYLTVVRDNDSKPLFETAYAPDDEIKDTLVFNFEVNKEDNLHFKLSSPTSIAWTKVKWEPEIFYSASSDPEYPNVISEDGKPLIHLSPVAGMNIYNKQLVKGTVFVPKAAGTFNVKPILDIDPIKFNSIIEIDYKGPAYFSIKKRDSLITRQTLFIYKNEVVDMPELEVNLSETDSLFIEYHFPLSTTGGPNIRHAKVEISNEDTFFDVQAGVWGMIHPENQYFGHMYHGWGQFVYNSSVAGTDKPINEALLKPDESMKNPKEVKEGEQNVDLTGDDVFNPKKSVFVMMFPDGDRKAFYGYDDLTYVSGKVISSSRYGEDNVPVPGSLGSGYEAVVKINRSVNNSFSGGVDVEKIVKLPEGLSVEAGANFAFGNNKIIADYQDMNGDRYPDAIDDKNIQYSSHLGGLSELIRPFPKAGEKEGSFNSVGGSAGGQYQKMVKESGGGKNEFILSGDASVSGSKSWNHTNYAWIDMNGDGLPDRVEENGNVHINLGYGFADPVNWGFKSISEGKGTGLGAGVGASGKFTKIDKWEGSIVGGINLSGSNNESSQTFIDMNADGLPDLVYVKAEKVEVCINNGHGFEEAIVWGSIARFSSGNTVNEGLNAAFTVGFTIFGAVKVCVNARGDLSNSFSKDKIQISDIDGDGFPDYLYSDSEGRIDYKASSIARTNLLRQVNRPLKSHFAIDYQRVGNTYEMPQSVWTLSKVEMNDGHKGDGVDKIQTSFEYANGYHDRHERTFYGFGEVKTKQLDEGGAEYRSTTRTFANNNYFEKGLLLNETIQDDKGNKYVETINEYELKDRDMKKLGNGAEKLSSTIAFPALVKTSKQFYEGKAVAQKSTYTAFEYGSYGNVHKYVDYGDEGDEDNISASIAYHELKDKNILSVPKSITVTGSGKTLRQRSTLIDETTGKITKITQQAKNGSAVYDLYYDNYGNLDSIVRPANYKGERMYFAYDYDKVVKSYVTAVRDAYGYSSSTTYDYKFGQVLSTTDINGKQTVYRIDELGRITDITGPYELESGQDYTIHFDYYPDAAIPWAQTKHYDPEHPENPIETAIFIDGLGRVLQTKKDGALFKGKDAEDKEVMLVSGKVMYDAFGRSIASYYPVSEDKGSIDVFNTAVNKVKPTTVAYDVLDRALVTTLPDGASTETEYGFGEDRHGNQQFMTRVTDANGISTESFTDVKGRQTAVKAPGDTWTSFVYNAINELVSVTDAEDNTTVSTYDMLGRRLSRLHPDAGLTEYSYDAAGNMLTQMTANLRENKQPITYEYEYNRLTNINYPENTVNNVRFEYGEAGAEHNRAGRIVVQEDATGAQEFFYGNLGEITKNIRTIIVPDDGVYTFETEWEYDTWNRLKKMTYPDGEELTYEYNKGGLLRRMYGQKKGHRYNYLKQVGYDEFEDRAYIAYGNGTETYYNYEEERRRLHNIVATTSAGRRMMDNTYSYDKVNNITMLKSEAPIPASSLKGGSFEYIYKYDDLYRLTDAAGHYKGATHEHKYRMAMDYSPTGSILSKKQNHVRKEYDESDWGPRHKTTYDLTYKYEGKQPHAPSQIGENTYTYDANGNTTGWQSTKNNNRRDILWDEENRIRAIADNGKTHHYLYDASGERVIKSTGDGQAIYINGFPMGGSGTVGSYTMYVNPYMVVTNSKFTKHFYIEGQRIVSKLGEMGEYQYLLNPKDSTAGGNTIDFDLKGKELKAAIYANFESLGLDGAVFTAGKSGKVPYGRLKKYYRNQDLVNGGGNANQPGSDETPSNKAENLQFYYHPDHLGSSSYITDVSGEVYQHMEYFPFGETFIEERTDAEYTAYLYNGKELDEETGLYYYGARYYDPRISIFYGVDPLAEKYSFQSPFAYAANNPIGLIDFNGMNPEEPPLTNTNMIGEVQVTAQQKKPLSSSQESGLNSVSVIPTGIEQQKSQIDANGGGVFTAGSVEQWMMLSGIGLAAEKSVPFADFIQQSNAEIRAAALRNGMPTERIDNFMRRTGNFGSGAKWLGRGVIGLSTGISVYQGYDAYTRGDMAGVTKAGLDIGVGWGTAAIGGIPGIVLYGTYMLIMTPPPGNPHGYVTPLCPVDNTYVAPPIDPRF